MSQGRGRRSRIRTVGLRALGRGSDASLGGSELVPGLVALLAATLHDDETDGTGRDLPGPEESEGPA